MNFCPLFTASVWPTISGTTVDRRDHVLMTFLSLPARFITSIFSSRCRSTNGPFFSERPITSFQLSALGYQLSFRKLFLSPLNDELVGGLAIPRLVALGRQTPRRYRVRSEERRVGKECRSGWAPDHEKKK